MLSRQNHLIELAKHRILLILQRFVNHVKQLYRCVERHSADTDFRKEVVFARLTPMPVVVVIPCAVETAVIKVGRNVVTLIQTAGLNLAEEAAEWYNVNIAAQNHHHDTILLIFLNDIVTNLILIVDTLHSCINVRHQSDLVAQSYRIVILAKI